MTDEAKQEPWHLQRGVPITLIVALIGQTLAFGWFASNLSSRVDYAIEVNNRQDVKMEATSTAVNVQEVSNATVTAQMSAVRESLQELKTGIAETNRLLRERAVGAQP